MYNWESVKCYVCEKEFIPAPEHLYKVKVKGRVKRVCSWGCMRKYEKAHEKKKDYEEW